MTISVELQSPKLGNSTVLPALGVGALSGLASAGVQKLVGKWSVYQEGWMCMRGLRGHSKKICKVRFNIDVRKYFFSNRVIDKWNNLDQDTVDAPSLNSFKNRLNKIRSTRMGFFMD